MYLFSSGFRQGPLQVTLTVKYHQQFSQQYKDNLFMQFRGKAYITLKVSL